MKRNERVDPKEYAQHIMKHGSAGAMVKWSGVLNVPADELQEFLKTHKLSDIISGWRTKVDYATGEIALLPKPNLVVNAGINVALDRLFGITASAALTIGVDNGTTAPTATSVSSTAGGGTDTGSTSRRIIALDSVASRTNQVVSAIGTYTQANVAFIMKRLFLSKAAAGTADASGDLIAMTAVFTIDLTAFSTWSQTFTAQLTGTGS